MSTRDDDILDFDFFDEEDPPSWEEPTEGGPGPPRDRGPRRWHVGVESSLAADRGNQQRGRGECGA